MAVPPEKEALRQAARKLADLVEASDPEVAQNPDVRVGGNGVDATVRVGAVTFVVEWKASGTTAAISGAAEQIRRVAEELGQGAVPVVAVPFMGELGRSLCEEAGVSWIDLSGNASLSAPGLRVRIEGRPNQFKSPGRPSNVFASKSSRVSRWLLMHPGERMSQREIARATGLDEGFTSRVVRRLEEDGLIDRAPNGAVRPSDPGLLLDAWRDGYDFSKHHVVRGHVPSRSGDALVRLLAERFARSEVAYAATGLGAAWLLSRFAGFRIATFYLEELPATGVLEELSYREEDRGANLWLVLPKDDGVFQGASEVEGIRCVHPVQVYLDLKGHPERSSEAAEDLRAELLDWNSDD